MLCIFAQNQIHTSKKTQNYETILGGTTPASTEIRPRHLVTPLPHVSSISATIAAHASPTGMIRSCAGGNKVCSAAT